MYEYHVYTNNLSLVIIPPCCSSMRKDFIFTPEEISIGLKESLLFQCPKCLETYPSLKDVFKSWTALILSLSTLNDKQSKYKQKSFTYSLSTNGFNYNFLDDICEFSKILKMPPIELSNNIEMDYRRISILISINGDGKIYKKFPPQPFLLSNLVIRCNKCVNHFLFNDVITESNSKQIECPNCKNKSKIPQRLIKEFQQKHKSFQLQILDSYKRKILVIPFDAIGYYYAIINGDIEMSKT